MTRPVAALMAEANAAGIQLRLHDDSRGFALVVPGGVRQALLQELRLRLDEVEQELARRGPAQSTRRGGSRR